MPQFDPSAPYSPAASSAAPGAGAAASPQFDPNAAYSPAPAQTGGGSNPASPSQSDGWSLTNNPVTHMIEGIGEGALQTLAGTDRWAREHMPAWMTNNPLTGMPADLDKQDELVGRTGPVSTAEKVGQGAEGIAEFVLGDGALKDLSISEKLGMAQKAAALGEKHPYIANLLKIGMDAARQGAVGGTQGALKSNADTTAGVLGSGAEAGGTAAAVSGLVGAAGEGLKSLRPGTVDIPYGEVFATPEEAGPGVYPGTPKDPVVVQKAINVPVRATVENPSVLGSVAEMAADKSALQKFDVLQTQPAARSVLRALAEEAHASTSVNLADTLMGAHKARVENWSSAINDLIGEASSDAERDSAIEMAGKDAREFGNVSQGLDSDLANDLRNKPGNFRDFANTFKARLRSLYQAVDTKTTTADGTKPFSVAQDAEKAAADAHDSAGVQSAIDKQRFLFDRVHGPGAYDGVRSLYSKVDAVDKIGSKFDSLGVIKSTPANLLPLATQGGRGVDSGMIDGAALQRAIRELSRDTEMIGGKPASVFDRAGIGKSTVLRLQELGRVLELSDPGRLKSKIGNILGDSTFASGAGALGFALTHALSGGSLTTGAAVGYGANKFLGYLMTNPKALDYTLRAARTLAPAVAAQASRQ
jgi:hypothetical protein